jgi:hypothetical protein
VAAITGNFAGLLLLCTGFGFEALWLSGFHSPAALVRETADADVRWRSGRSNEIVRAVECLHVAVESSTTQTSDPRLNGFGQIH